MSIPSMQKNRRVVYTECAVRLEQAVVGMFGARGLAAVDS